MRLIQICAWTATLAIIGCTARTANAQSTTEVGVKVGLNFATVTEFGDAIGDVGLETSRRTGLLFGGYISRRWSGNLFVQPEVLLVQKGIKVSGGAFDIPVDAAVKLTYLEIPILLQYRFGDRSVVPYVFAGPAIGFNTSAKVDSSVFGVGGMEDEDVSDEVRNVETSLVVGGGAAGDWWLGELRYSEGLWGVNEADTPDFDRDVRNRGIAVVFGVRF